MHWHHPQQDAVDGAVGVDVDAETDAEAEAAEVVYPSLLESGLLIPQEAMVIQALEDGAEVEPSSESGLQQDEQQEEATDVRGGSQTGPPEQEQARASNEGEGTNILTVLHIGGTAAMTGSSGHGGPPSSTTPGRVGGTAAMTGSSGHGTPSSTTSGQVVMFGIYAKA